MITGLYDFMESLIIARDGTNKLQASVPLKNVKPDILSLFCRGGEREQPCLI